jgi:hypothetical protein
MDGDDNHRRNPARAARHPADDRPGRSPADRDVDHMLARIARHRTALIERLSSVLRIRASRAQWRRHHRRNVKALRHLDRNMRNAVTPPVTAVPSLEQIIVDLRRLGRQRRTLPTTSSVRWLAAVTCAYDLRLTLACRILGLPEHLEALQGMDRDIERLRIEAVLYERGIRVRKP